MLSSMYHGALEKGPPGDRRGITDNHAAEGVGEFASRAAMAMIIPRFERIAENSMDITELTTPISLRASVP